MKFSDILQHTGYNYYIPLPERYSRQFPQKGYIPVCGTINNVEFIGKLAPRKPNKHVLYLHYDIRIKTGIKEGDKVEACIEYDPVSRDIPIPDDIELILRENKRNWNHFLQLSPSRRNEFLSYVIEAKRPETRLKRIELVIKRIAENSARKNSR